MDAPLAGGTNLNVGRHTSRQLTAAIVIAANLVGRATGSGRVVSPETLADCSSAEVDARLRYVAPDDTIVIELADRRYVELKVRDVNPESLAGRARELSLVGDAVVRSKSEWLEVWRDDIVAVCSVPPADRGVMRVAPYVIIPAAVLAAFYAFVVLPGMANGLRSETVPFP